MVTYKNQGNVCPKCDGPFEARNICIRVCVWCLSVFRMDDGVLKEVKK